MVERVEAATLLLPEFEDFNRIQDAIARVAEMTSDINLAGGVGFGAAQAEVAVNFN